MRQQLVAPAVATAAADASGNEGDTLGTSGAFSDADGNNTLTIMQSSGDGTVTGNWIVEPADH